MNSCIMLTNSWITNALIQHLNIVFQSEKQKWKLKSSHFKNKLVLTKKIIASFLTEKAENIKMGIQALQAGMLCKGNKK